MNQSLQEARSISARSDTPTTSRSDGPESDTSLTHGRVLILPSGFQALNTTLLVVYD